LFRHNTTANVTHWKDVNRYGYSPIGLFIPYALACLFTSIIVIIGVFTFKHDGVHPDRKVEDILQWSQQAVQKAWPGRPVWRGLMPRIK
jgi:hypothetical protein